MKVSSVLDALRDITEAWRATLVVSLTAVAADLAFQYFTRALREREALLRAIRPKAELQPKDAFPSHRHGSTAGAAAAAPCRAPAGHSFSFDRAAYRAQLLVRFRSLATYTCFVHDIGSGASSLLKRIAATEPSVVYVGCAHIRTRGDLARAVRAAFGLAATARTSSYAARTIVAVLHALKASTGASDESGDGDDVADDDDARAWASTCERAERVVAAMRDHPAACAFVGPLACLGPVPVVVFDEVDSLEPATCDALQRWAAALRSGGLAHCVLAVTSPYDLVGTAHSFGMGIVSLKDVTPEDVAAYLLARCEGRRDANGRGLAPETAARIAALTGGRIGSAAKVAQVITEVLCFDAVDALDVGASGAATAVVAAAMAPLSGDDARAADALVAAVSAFLLRDLFGLMRRFHLYTAHPTGDAELDELRRGIFRIAMFLLDRGGNPLDVAAFEPVIEACTFKTFLALLNHRSALPFSIHFNSVRFQSSATAHALLSTLGEGGSEKRAKAVLLVDTL